MQSNNKSSSTQKKIRLPEVLIPLAEKVKKYKSAKTFTYYVYGDITWYQFEQIGKLTNNSYGSRASQDPAINAPKDFYNFIKNNENNF